MLHRVATLVAQNGGKERPVVVRVVSLASGVLVFVVIAPVLLGFAGHAIARSVALTVPRYIELLFGAVGTAIGLFFLLWSISAFWVIGKGTPVPLVSPTRLITTGLFSYCRNPLVFGLILFYFGAGTICDELVTGLFMLVVALVLSAAYHKCVEERELLLRYGGEYREYRERTSFFIPMRPKKRRHT